jgi:hypothetical protein
MAQPVPLHAIPAKAIVNICLPGMAFFRLASIAQEDGVADQLQLIAPVITTG